MKKIYLLLIASIWGFTLFGQESITLRWQITNDQNEPLVGVSVWKKQTTEGTETDKNGMFSIDVVTGRDELEISYLGYQTSKLVIRSGMKLKGTEMLFPAEYDLPEVKITAYGSCCCLRSYGTRITTELDSLPEFIIAKPNIRIFPIPTSASVFLQQETSLGKLDLYTLSGQKLQSFNFSDQFNASIDLSIWPAGTYLLRSNAGWVEKVILQKQ